MVDAKSVEFSLGDEFQDQLVGLVEDLFVLGAKGGEIVDIEEAAVVDVVGGDTPLREAVRLGLDEFMQRVEATGIVGRAVDRGYILEDECFYFVRSRAQSDQTTLLHFLFTVALDFLLGRGATTVRQVAERGDDALQVQEIFVGGADSFLQTFDLETQNARVLLGIDRKAMLKIKDAELSALGVEGQFQIAALQHVAVLIRKNRYQDFALKFILDRATNRCRRSRRNRRPLRFREHRATRHCRCP